MKIISLVLTLLLSTILFAENTENWDKTFKSELLSTYFTKEKLKVVVVYSGENQDELKLAYKSLSNSLKNIKNIKSVLSNNMLGNTTKLDDKSIIKRAGFLDIDYIIIMRIFKDDDKFSAVVSLYNKKGDLLTGIFSEKGTQIEMHSHAPQQETKEILDKKETEKQLVQDDKKKEDTYTKAPSETEKKQNEEKVEQDEENRDVINDILKHKVKKNVDYEKKEKEFEENYLAFEEVTLIDIDSKKVIDSWTSPILGKYQKELSWSEFYKKAGRKDLANKYDKMKRSSYILFATSLVSFASTYFFVHSGDKIYTDEEINRAPEGSERRSEMESANFDSTNGMPVIEPLGWILISVGLATFVTAGIMSRYQPVELDELRRIADIHNQKLRKDLGLDNKQAKSQEISFDYSITPYAAKNTGGVLLDVKF